MTCDKRKRVFLLGLVLCALAMCSSAQDYDDRQDMPETRRAYLSMNFDTRGGAELKFTLDRKPDSWDTLRSAMRGGLRCPEAQVASPGATDANMFGMSYMSAQQKEHYLRLMAEYNLRRLNVHCASILSRDHAVVAGDLDLAPLAAALRSLEVQQLILNIEHPGAAFVQFSRENLADTPYEARSAFLTYKIPLQPPAAPSPIHLAYGFRRQDLQGAFAILIGFLLVPLSWMLWMQRSVLRAGKEDPVAASFSYFRVLNWCGTGAILLWIVSGLGARQNLQDWIHFLCPPGWRAAVAGVLITLVPAWLVYFLCIAISYSVFVQLRGNTSTRKEFLSQHMAAVGAQVLPLSFLLAGIELFHQNPRLSAGFFAAAYFSRVICLSWQMKVSKTVPQTLSTGGLRDRVFALAQKAGVKIQQVMVMPAGKGQMANAFASRTNLVIFTDYLLQRLSKREVDAVAAHELTHLRHRHPLKLQCALLAAIFTPSWLPYAAGMVLSIVMIPLALLGSPLDLMTPLSAWALKFGSWSQHNLILILVGLTGFYFLSRRFERTADAGAVALTGDPEAKISALLKLNRLNLMPIQWDKVTGSWLTHPSTLHRVQRIAADANLPPERLRQILDRHTAEQQGSRADIGPAGDLEPRYTVPAVSDPDRIRSATRRLWGAQAKLWILLALHVLPAMTVAWLVAMKQWNGNRLLLSYVAGLVLTLTLVTCAGLWLAVMGLGEQKRRIMEQFRRKGIAVAANPIAVGFSPDPSTRFYGAHQFNWDVGVLTFAAEHLTYIGEQTQFSLTRNQITASGLGPGSPSWWSIPRLFVQWKDLQSGREGTFNLSCLEACSPWQYRDQNRRLANRLLNWRSQGTNDATQPHASELQSPNIGNVTSISPRETGKFRRFSKVSLMLLLVAVGACTVFGIHTTGYVFGVALLTQIFGLIPCWRYREKQFAAPGPASNASAARAGSSQ